MENKAVVVQDNTEKDQKEFYEEIEVEVIVFDEEDIILASECKSGRVEIDETIPGDII